MKSCRKVVFSIGGIQNESCDLLRSERCPFGGTGNAVGRRQRYCGEEPLCKHLWYGCGGLHPRPNTGHRITVGSEFGHEMISKVVQVGKNVKDIEVGMMVYPYPRLAKGDPKRVGTVGGFSEYVLIPDAELDKQVYDIPTRIPAREVCLIEPFTVGFRAARRAEPKPGENAIVFGA